MIHTRKIRRQVVPTFSFVVDGETEIWYLQMLKRNERQLKLNIEPKLPQRKSIDEQFKLVKDLSEREYSKVFWIVDLDTITKESRETPKGRKSPLKTLIELRKKLQKDNKNVISNKIDDKNVISNEIKELMDEEQIINGKTIEFGTLLTLIL